MSKEQTPIERLEKKMQSFAMKSYQYNELNALIQEIKTEREQYANAKVLEALERVQSDIGEWIPRHMKLKEKQFNEKEKQFTKGRIDCMMQISSHIETEVKPKYNDNI